MDPVLADDIRALSLALGVEDDSFLCHPLNSQDPQLPEQIIDGLTLAFVTFCYHRHPRGENVYELMDQLDAFDPDSVEAEALTERAEEAAALQIPFIVNMNRLLEDYFQIRRRLEDMIAARDLK
ncbi:MAG TPA: hypothetical protein PLL06_04140 [Acidobacteriota bacterium]|nr:hypothetical protein [Acidobacteriota bacterium]HMZ78867.1 hypothetical protein [Acidobacteriota bacterium]HNB69814.1 hypothetical protein [Acidobacteriota bacterium]HNC44522.1 hypothetical protein [Acidobacteriota bacterium]HNG91442.1 hypothetical protein [Acidobacteriota bacterium]